MLRRNNIQRCQSSNAATPFIGSSYHVSAPIVTCVRNRVSRLHNPGLLTIHRGRLCMYMFWWKAADANTSSRILCSLPTSTQTQGSRAHLQLRAVPAPSVQCYHVQLTVCSKQWAAQYSSSAGAKLGISPVR
jgi:hypothetical protein